MNGWSGLFWFLPIRVSSQVVIILPTHLNCLLPFSPPHSLLASSCLKKVESGVRVESVSRRRPSRHRILTPTRMFNANSLYHTLREIED